MKAHLANRLDHIVQKWTRGTLLLIAAAILAACAGGTPTPEPPAGGTAEAAPESPLAQPESPVLQGDSPLTAPIEVKRLFNEDEAIALATASDAPEPGEGFGSISGLAYSHGTVPGSIPETQYYLAEAVEIDGELLPPPVFDGPDIEGGEIYGMTNMAGQIVAKDVPPGNYYFAIWTLYGWLLAFPSAEDGSPRLITVEEGDQLNLGMLWVDWP